MHRLDYLSYGGNGIEAEDFEWLQNAILEGFQNVLKGLGADPSGNMILFGCEVTGAIAAGSAFSAGAVSIGGEPCTVDAGVLPTLNPGEVFMYQLVITNDPTGLEPLESGGTTNQYKIRKATIVSAAASGSYLAPDGQRLGRHENWRYVGAPGEPAFENGCSVSTINTFLRPLRFRKTKDNRVELSGMVRIPNANIATLATIFTLPAGYIPKGAPTLSVNYSEFPSPNPNDCMYPTFLLINTRSLVGGTENGKVFITNLKTPPNGGDAMLFLDGIFFSLD